MYKLNIKFKDNAAIILISLIGFFGIFSTTISKNPVLSLFTNALNPSDAVIGLIASISPLAGIIFSFPVGFLADKLGKKKLLMLSALVFITAPLLYLLINDAWLLIPVRFFHGMSTAILGPVTAAIICEKYPDNKGEKLGLYASATLIGRTLAPVLGGFIISFFAFFNNIWNYKLVYMAAFCISLPVLIFSMLIREDQNTESIKKISIKDFFKAIADFLTEKKLLGTSLIEMSIYFTFGSFETFLPVYLKSIDFPAFLTGIIFSIQVFSIALTKPLFGRLSDFIDRRIQIMIGLLILCIPFVLIPVFKNPFIIIGLSVIFGLGMSLSTVATSTYVADIAKKERLGSSMGALSAIMDIGHSSGPFLTGIVISLLILYKFKALYLTGFLTSLAVCVLSILIFALFNFNPGKERS